MPAERRWREAMPEKRNASLLLELACWRLEREKLLREGAEAALEDLDSRRLDVFITYDGPVAALRQRNLTVGHYDGTVATGSILLRDVDALCSLHGVKRVCLAARVFLHIDRSIPEIKANALRSNAPPYVGSGGGPAYTGKGVLIGVIDDALYERHLSFTHPNPNVRPQDRKTRIIAIWDQISAPSGPGQASPPPPFNRGTLWTEAQINGVLAVGAAGFNTIKVSSEDDHGTHVTGIAAGNGALRDNQFAPFTFVGVAPEADLAFCNAAQLTSNSANIVDAMNFIFKLAEDRGQPCVINMSFGTHEGARDGSSDLERAIDRALTDQDGEPRPRRAVVVAAGNEGDMRRHARKLMAAGGQLVFRMFVAEVKYPSGLTTKPRPAGDRIIGYDNLVIWYAGAASIEIRITPPGGPPEPPMFVGAGGIQVTPRVRRCRLRRAGSRQRQELHHDPAVRAREAGRVEVRAAGDGGRRDTRRHLGGP
jgi:Subtilase family